MTHEEALNKILSNACGSLTDEEVVKNGGIQRFHIELHCSEYIVQAKPLGNLKYEIVSVDSPEAVIVGPPDQNYRQDEYH